MNTQRKEVTTTDTAEHPTDMQSIFRTHSSGNVYVTMGILLSTLTLTVTLGTFQVWSDLLKTVPKQVLCLLDSEYIGYPYDEKRKQFYLDYTMILTMRSKVDQHAEVVDYSVTFKPIKNRKRLLPIVEKRATSFLIAKFRVYFDQRKAQTPIFKIDVPSFTEYEDMPQIEIKLARKGTDTTSPSSYMVVLLMDTTDFRYYGDVERPIRTYEDLLKNCRFNVFAQVLESKSEEATGSVPSKTLIDYFINCNKNGKNIDVPICINKE